MDSDAQTRARITERLVAHETHYFADPFDPAPWRAALAEPMPRAQG